MSSVSDPNYFVLESSDGKLLRSVLNEILNGFAIDNFESTVGTPRSDLEKLFQYLSGLPHNAQVKLTQTQVGAAYNALRETLRELGNEEFQIRTGFDFTESETMLRRLGQLLRLSDLA
jgi:hypothetical protein